MDPAPATLTLHEFLETPIGRKVPPVTRLIATKLESGEAPEQIARALGIQIETVNNHIKVIQCFPCRSEDEKFLEAEQHDEDLERFAAALHKAVAADKPKMLATEAISPSSAIDGEAAQRAKVLEYLDSPRSGKLFTDARKQLRMWSEGASQREVGRKLGVDQGNLSRRIKAALNEACRMESAEKKLVSSKVAPRGRPRSDDALTHATTGGKTHERWAIDRADLPARSVRRAGAGPDR
jgi:DNA-binding CsgD family transcriptional regulator